MFRISTIRFSSDRKVQAQRTAYSQQRAMKKAEGTRPMTKAQERREMRFQRTKSKTLSQQMRDLLEKATRHTESWRRFRAKQARQASCQMKNNLHALRKRDWTC